MESSVIPPKFFLSSDFGFACREFGLRMFTAAAVRAARREGRLVPSGYTPGRVAIWTAQDMEDEVLRLAEQADEIRSEGERGRRMFQRRVVSGQAELFGGREMA